MTLPVMLLQGEVTIHYNKLQADPKQGMSLDIGKSGTAAVSMDPETPSPTRRSGPQPFSDSDSDSDCFMAKGPDFF